MDLDTKHKNNITERIAEFTRKELRHLKEKADLRVEKDKYIHEIEVQFEQSRKSYEY